MSRTVAKDGACSSKDVLSSSKAVEGVSHLLKQYQINNLRIMRKIVLHICSTGCPQSLGT